MKEMKVFTIEIPFKHKKDRG